MLGRETCTRQFCSFYWIYLFVTRVSWCWIRQFYRARGMDTLSREATLSNPVASRLKRGLEVLVLLLVALWFILRGDLLYVFPCVILFLCFSVLLVLRLPRLGKRELILVLFVRLFGLCLFRFVGFLFLLGSGKGCGL